MPFSPASPVTGAVIAPLVTPTYTIVADVPPDVNAEQYAVTALGGTQSGVSTHTASNPFTLAMFRPKTFKSLPTPNPVNNRLPSVPKNEYKIITRKGAVPLANQPPENIIISTTISLPAGVDVYSTPELAAALSLHIGAMSAEAADIFDTCKTGIL